MDRVTASYLSEFAKEHELEHFPQDQQFDHLAAFATVRRHYNGETFHTDDVVVDSGDDTEIDAVAILVNGSLVVDVESLEDHADVSGHFDVTLIFVQATRTSSFEAAKIGTFGFGVVDFFASDPKLRRNKMVQSAAEIMEELYRHGTKFRPGNPTCRLYYVTTGTWNGDDHTLEARRNSVENDLRALSIFREVEFTCVGADGLRRLYDQTRNAVTREFTFSNRTTVPDIDGVTEAYIGFVPLSEFLSIITDDEGELLQTIFYENVRDWQDYTASVNCEIRETLLSDHKNRFVLMNNGITVIAHSLRTVRANRLQIEDFQIVNGCQTTNVLFDLRDQFNSSDAIMIPLRLIATQNEEVINSIIRATNRQTKVEDDQFFALTEFAEKIEAYFKAISLEHRLYYERRSGQYARQNVHNTRIVSHRNLVRAVASVFLEVPHQTTRSYRTVRGRIGTEIFADSQRLEPYYTAALTLYKLDVNFRTQRLPAKLKPARFHIILAMRFLANPHQLPRMNAREMERYCKIITDMLEDNSKADDLCARAAQVVEEVAGGNFDRDNIRTNEFTDKVIAKCREITQVNGG